MKKQLIISLIVLGIGFTGCEKFLTELPKDSVAPETFYKTKDQLTAALMAVYSPLGNTDESTYSRFFVLEGQSTDEFTPSSAAATAVNAALYNTSASYVAFNNAWNNLYLGIERANLLLENLDKSTASADDVKQIKGEALFLRAYYHFLLVSYFGDVPLKITTTKKASDIERPRTPAKEVYDKVIADMTEAEGLVKTSSAWGVTNTARISKTGVEGILSRVCLHAAGRLQNTSYLATAVTWGKKVVASGEHRLNPDFKQVFINESQDIDDNKECIWEVQFSRDANGANSEYERFGSSLGIKNDDIVNGGFMQGLWFTTGTYYESFTNGDLRRDWTIANFTFAPGVGTTARSPLNGNLYVNPTAHWSRTLAKWRRGYQNPSQIIIKNFGPTNFPLLRYSDVLLTLAEAENELDGPTLENIDYVNQVRKRGYGVDFVGRNINNLTVTNGGISGYTLNSVVTISGGGASKDAKASIAAISSGKITAITLTDVGTNYTSSPTITVSGGTGAIITATISNLTDYQIKVSDYNKNTFKTFLMAERSRELAGESHRKLDLMRWKNFVSTMKGMIPAVTLGAKALLPIYNNVSERDTLYPIPLNEINLNPAMAGKQNAGWN